MLSCTMVCTPEIVLHKYADPDLLAPFIFKGFGLNGRTTSLLATGVVGVVMFLATIPAVLYVDKLGRKNILMIGGK